MRFDKLKEWIYPILCFAIMAAIMVGVVTIAATTKIDNSFGAASEKSR